jgi:hypothetical protein
MKRAGLLALVFAMTPFGAVSAQVADRPALDLTSSSADGAFARSVIARYGSSFTRAQVLADLRAHGFSCDAAGAACTHVVMNASCADTRSVDIAQDGSISADHRLLCMGAMADDE